jgi:hypothetical protein
MQMSGRKNWLFANNWIGEHIILNAVARSGWLAADLGSTTFGSSWRSTNLFCARDGMCLPIEKLLFQIGLGTDEIVPSLHIQLLFLPPARHVHIILYYPRAKPTNNMGKKY